MDSLITMIAIMIALVIVVPVALWIIDFALFIHDWNDDNVPWIIRLRWNGELRST